jgi:hypothetical protein
MLGADVVPQLLFLILKCLAISGSMTCALEPDTGITFWWRCFRIF